MKIRTFYKTKIEKQSGQTLSLIALVLALGILLVTLTGKIHGVGITLGATVKPTYKLEVIDGTLNLKTNMHLNVNGIKIR